MPLSGNEVATTAITQLTERRSRIVLISEEKRKKDLTIPGQYGHTEAGSMPAFPLPTTNGSAILSHY